MKAESIIIKIILNQNVLEVIKKEFGVNSRVLGEIRKILKKELSK